MARVIYVDSGFFIALIDRTDDAHAQAYRLYESAFADTTIGFVTSRDVLNEVLAHFSRSIPESKQGASTLARGLLEDPDFRVVVFDDAEYLAALDLYENRIDKRYSMVDCIGMTLMRSEDITQVVATDRDFQQEGFTNLMVRNL